MNPTALILAAGKGTRMESDLPKVCHEVGGRPMVCAVVDACIDAGCDRVVVVVGYKQELVREALASYGDKVEFAVQHEQLGTGHAVVSAMVTLPLKSTRTPITRFTVTVLIMSSKRRAAIRFMSRSRRKPSMPCLVISTPTLPKVS